MSNHVLKHSDTKDRRTGKIGIARRPQLLEWIAEGKTAIEIADLLNVNQETVRKFARKRDIQIQPVDQTLEKHPSWKGGVTMTQNGYLQIRVEEDGLYGYLIRTKGKDRTESTGYAFLHRVEMHKKIGRPLLRTEVVDHIDGDKKNNDPSNLRLFASNAEHLRVTLKGKTPKWTDDGIARMQARVVTPEARARMGNRTPGPRAGRRGHPQPISAVPLSTGEQSRIDDLASPSLFDQTPS